MSSRIICRMSRLWTNHNMLYFGAYRFEKSNKLAKSRRFSGVFQPLKIRLTAPLASGLSVYP